MSEYVQLKAEDRHELDAYVAKPVGEPIAGLVVVQEILGLMRIFAQWWMVLRRMGFWLSRLRCSIATSAGSSWLSRRRC